jgi:hypothetical protein
MGEWSASPIRWGVLAESSKRKVEKQRPSAECQVSVSGVAKSTGQAQRGFAPLRVRGQIAHARQLNIRRCHMRLSG